MAIDSPSRSRREILWSLAASQLLAGAALASELPIVFGFPLPEGAPRLIEWEMDGGHRIAALVPEPPISGPLPMVVALHGAGETRKPPREGALGWPRDYALIRAMGRRLYPPLAAADFEGLIGERALTEANRELSREPYRGLVVVCPRIPPLGDGAVYESYVRWLASELVPEARLRLPVLQGRESTGIDGVSLGALLSMRVGLAHPELFSAVGVLQPALPKGRGPEVAGRLERARAVAPTRFRLTTSDQDLYRPAALEIHAHLLRAGLAHDFSDLAGPHGYEFNRGPGAMELLRWHDRILRIPPT